MYLAEEEIFHFFEAVGRQVPRVAQVLLRAQVARRKFRGQLRTLQAAPIDMSRVSPRCEQKNFGRPPSAGPRGGIPRGTPEATAGLRRALRALRNHVRYVPVRPGTPKNRPRQKSQLCGPLGGGYRVGPPGRRRHCSLRPETIPTACSDLRSGQGKMQRGEIL